jgi:hypothetical protein
VAITYANDASAASAVVKAIERDGGKAVAIQADAANVEAEKAAVKRPSPPSANLKRQRDEAFGADLAWSEGTPVVLAALTPRLVARQSHALRKFTPCTDSDSDSRGGHGRTETPLLFRSSHVVSGRDKVRLAPRFLNCPVILFSAV